jgi:hypothetical protein
MGNCSGSLGADTAPYAHILHNILNVLCKNQRAHTAYIIKTRCFSNNILPLYADAAPYARHVFLGRENTNAGARSMVRAFISRRLCFYTYEWKQVGTHGVLATISSDHFRSAFHLVTAFTWRLHTWRSKH